MLQALLNKNKRELPELRDMSDEADLAFLEQSKPHLEALEEIRLAKFKSFSWRKKIAIPVAVALTPPLAYIDVWLMFLRGASDDGSVAGVSAVFIGALYWWVTQPRRQYAVAYKEKILPKLADLFGGFIYWIDGQIPMHKMIPSKIVPRHDKYETEDYFTGRYKGVNVEFSEVNLKQKRRRKNSTHYVSVFKGLAILLDMNAKKFYGHTLLDRDRTKITEWFKEKTDGLKRANLVDPEFEKIFDVYTNDQVEARYLIDPVMMERLKAVRDEYNGEEIVAAFYESKLLILVQSKHNYFEPADLEIPATDPRSLVSMKREIGQILSLVDRLSLYDPEEARGARD